MNLWADFDNNQEIALTTIGNRHTRRLTERLILSSLREWLLNEYVAAYCHSLVTSRIFRRCYWVDALGINAKENALSPTPIENDSKTHSSKKRKKEMLQVVPPALQPVITLGQRLGLESKPLALYGLILEAGSSKRKELRATHSAGNAPTNAQTKEVLIPKESGIVHASWLEVAPSLLQEIDQSPAIFLLNPFGHTLFSYDDLVPLYQRSMPTELLFCISHRQLEQRLLAALRAPAQAAALTALLRSDRWKVLPIKEGEMQVAIDGLIDLLITSMKRHFLLPTQRIALPILVRPAVVEMAPYTVIFATRRQDSLLSMNDAICLNSRRVYAQSYHGLLTEEWFVTQQRIHFEEELQTLYQHVLQQGQAQRTRRWPDMRQQLLVSHFGRYTVSEYDSIICQLLQSGKVRCQWKRIALETEEGRIPANDDTLLWLE
jgi:hypothetical protein